MEINPNDYVTHYGVKGMKWGLRKAQVTVAGIRARLKPKVDGRVGPEINKSLNSKKVRTMSSKKADQLSAQREKEWKKLYNNRGRMTNEELSSALKRLNLENQFAQQVKTASELTAPGPSSRDKSREFIRKFGSAAVTVSKVAPIVIDSMPSVSPDLKEASGKMKDMNKILNGLNAGKKKS